MTRVPNIANWGVFASYRIFMLAMVAAADSASTVRKQYSIFIYSKTEPHDLYAIYKQTLTLCVLQYILAGPLHSKDLDCKSYSMMIKRLRGIEYKINK